MSCATSSKEFTYAEVLRWAAEQTLSTEFETQPSCDVTTPLFSGTVIAHTVQPGLTVTASDLVYADDNHMGAHIEASVTCGVLIEGTSGRLVCEGIDPIEFKPQRAQIIGVDEPVSGALHWRKGQRSRVAGLDLKTEFFERFSDQADDQSLASLQSFMDGRPQIRQLPHSPRILQIANHCFSQTYLGTLGQLFHEANALNFVFEITRLLEERQSLTNLIGTRRYDQTMQAREILDASLNAPPKTLDLGRMVGTNVTTLQANFKAAFGTTIFGYIREQRLEMARYLLLDHGLKVSEAGYRVGFSSPAAFSSAYRRRFGHPPSVDSAAGK